MNQSESINRIPYVVALAMLFFSAGLARAGELSFPRISAEDLNGRAVELPADLPGDPSLILVAFIRKQQGDIDKWIEALGLNEATSSIKWIELPYVGTGALPFKAIIDKGMRTGIKTTEARARTITVYEDHKKIIDALKLKGTDQIYVVVSDREGKVRTVVEGTPNEEKIQVVRKALVIDQRVVD